MSTAANPRADNPQQGGQESTGAIAKDSLAAESMREGGEFSQNQNAHISSVSGSNSTFNTTDTSGASVLHAAPDGDSRADDTLRGMGSDDKGPGGMKYSTDDSTPQFAGTESNQGSAGGNNSSSTGNKDSSQTTSGGTTFSGATGDSFSDSSNLTGNTTDQKDPAISSGAAAVSGSQSTGQQQSTSTSSSSAPYRADPSSQSSGLASNTTGPDFTEGQLKPKGKNLTEGDIPETKTFTGDVGGQHDPGRVAEQGFQKVAADDTVGAAADKYEGSGASGDARTGGAFDALSSERA